MKKMKIIIPVLFVSLLLTMVLVLPMPSSVTAAENLAANGDLELGSTTGWEITNASINSSVKYAGNYSLKLTATTAYSGAAYKIVPVRKNATVTVSFYYRYDSDPGSGKTYQVYTYKGSNSDAGAYADASATLSIPSGCDAITTWKQASYTFNSGDYSSIYLKFCPGGNGSSACYIDNLVVTAEGGQEQQVAPYLTSFGTKYNHPQNVSYNVIQQGGFENTANAQWNTTDFLSGGVQVVEDATAPEGSHSLFFDGSAVKTAAWHSFAVTVEKYTQYTFSAWVKSPRLSAQNKATATFGVMDATNSFMVYEPYQGNGYGSAIHSSPTLQLRATSPDDEWHLRSVTFYSGTHTTVYIGIYGANSQLYLDDIALYKSSNGVEYISPLRTDVLSAGNNSGNKYCADEDSLIEGIYMTTNDAQLTWSKNPAWRNGFLSFVESDDAHGTVLQYTASAHTERQLHYIDWIDVKPNTSYTLTLDVKRLAAGGGRIALLDDDYDSPKEFYTIPFNTTDGDWVTYSITFTTESYSRIGFAIVDGGGQVLMDEVRLFETAHGIADEPIEAPAGPQPTLKPQANGTSVMEMNAADQLVLNSDFENSVHSWDIYQGTNVTADAAHSGNGGAHLKGDGSWGAMIEQRNIPVVEGQTYTLSLWYKANANGANIALYGTDTGTQYAYLWADKGEWTYFTATFTVEGDTSLRFNVCGGGDGIAEDIYLDDVCVSGDAVLGVAFRFEQEGFRIYANGKGEVNLASATVIPYGDGEAYTLLRMGALVTNKAAFGEDELAMTLSGVNGITVVNVPVVYVWNVSASGCSYAVRVVNVPQSAADTQIYARPYYVFEKDGEEIVVYGDIVHRSYNE